MSTEETFADEGMWLFNNLPKKQLKEVYDFVPTEPWLEHVQKSSVRFNNGGSGSFVSANGLVMTNHHVAFDALEKLSTPENNYAEVGYYAAKQEDELKAKGLELNVLMSIEDVTERVKGAVQPGMSDEEKFAARRGMIAKVEAESLKQTGLRSDVVTLYQGGQYHLYRFKRYTDVRLVFAPHTQAAFFGGDTDNFSYPRYCLDVAFFRVYEDGQPLKARHYLKWSKAGPSKDELVFVSGHPGRTSRLNTVAELKYLRDTGYPSLLERYFRLEVMASVFSGRGPEEKRRAKDYLFGVSNGRKARKGALQGLLTPSFMARKVAKENALKAAVRKMPELKETLKAWKTIADVQKVRRKLIVPYGLFEGGQAFNTTYFGYARTLVRASEEFAKPNAERLREYSDAGKESLKFQLLAETPIYPDFEAAKLTDSLTWLAVQIGPEKKLVKKILAGKSPRERAEELVAGTKLGAKELRETLFEGGKKAVDACNDPMIELARLVDKTSRKIRKEWETKVDEPKRQAYDMIAKAKFAIEGTDTYPDATFTLRLAFGTCKGYEQSGKTIPFQTTFAGLYERAKKQGNAEAFELPEIWIERKDKLDLSTPYNFVCTADIIGGNSGSPVINRDAEVVGLIFDGNVQSLVLDFAFTDVQARAVSVHSQGIIEALKAIYQADGLVNEILAKK
ncbi:MAG: S46 family peptidase [Gemmataceae bacterium]